MSKTSNSNSKNYKGKGDSYKGKKSYHNNKSGNANFKEGEDTDTNLNTRGANKGSKGGNNDPNWYAISPQLLADSASFPYSEPVGTIFDPTNGQYMPGNMYRATSALPGVCAIAIAPGVGYSDSEVSAVNIAARNIYSYVRHANSGHSNYNSPDLMMYLLAMDSAYSYYSFLTRAYGIMRTYSISNKYMPKALITSMSLDHSDLQSNLANLRYYINLYATRLSAMVTPNVMSFFIRHYWLYQGVYSDSTVLKSQLYAFVPHGFHKFVPFEDTKGGMLEYLPFYSANSLKTLDDLISFGNSLIEPIIADEDMNIMSGDILKAFGNNIFKLALIPEEHLVVPEYNEEVLSQIQNATLMGSKFYDGVDVDTQTSANITQSDDVILYTPKFSISSPGYLGARTCTIRKDVVSPSDTMVATRLMNTVVQENYDGVWFQLHTVCDSLGSEVAMHATVWTWCTKSDGELYLAPQEMFYANSISNVAQGGADPNYGTLQHVVSIEKFDWHPCLRLVDWDLSSGAEGARYYGEFFDVDNYTKIDSYALKKMHDTALMSMFAVPLLGTMRK